MKDVPSTLLILVDGLGLGVSDTAVNPVCGGVCSSVESVLRDDSVSADTRLGVPGLPQSATGQATLLTGINAAEMMGRHVEGFPGERLKAMIAEHNIFRRMSAGGVSSTFANAYFSGKGQEVGQRRIQSVTTVATLSAFGSVRDTRFMEKNEAVYHDLTRSSLRARGYEGPLLRPSESAEHLVSIAERHDFTLFEYFQTDRAGHTGKMKTAERVLALFDEFLAALLPMLQEAGITMVLTSDHGNIEDMRTRRHTVNPVPFAVVGAAAENLKRRVSSIADVTPALLDWHCGGR